MKCEFPFPYKDGEHSACTIYDDSNGEPWCGTSWSTLEEFDAKPRNSTRRRQRIFAKSSDPELALDTRSTITLYWDHCDMEVCDGK